MSLQVWLPLTKDLRQQGVSNVSVVNSGATFNSTGGKLGGCYAFDGTDDRLSYTPDVDGLEEFSVALWLCPTSNTSAPSGAYFSIERGNYWQVTFWSDKVGIRDNSIGYNGTRKDFSTGTYTPNIWTHIAVTYNKGTLKIYRDGTLLSTNSVGGTKLNTGIDNARIGSAVQDGYFHGGKINDVRFYDNCLSAEEIKRISQGLIVHYPLNHMGLGQENIFLNSSLTDLTSSNLSSKIYYQGSYVPVITEDGLKFTWTGTSAREIDLYLGETLDLDTYYTLSFIYRSNMDIGSAFYLRNNGTLVGYWSQPTIPYSANWSRYTCTFKPINYQSNDATTGTLLTLFYSGYTENKWIELKQNSIKLEKGSIRTPWCPNSSDDIYIQMGLNANIEYDTSGFCNDGTRYGTYTWSSDTPKYSVSQYFENYTRYIQCTLPAMVPTAVTMNCWIKSSNKTPYGNYHEPLNINGTNFEFAIYYNGNFRSGYVIGGTRYVKNHTGTDILDGQWHMITSTYDGTDFKTYIDAVLIDTTTVSGALTAMTPLRIGAFGASTSYGSTQLYESDVRVYVTALSADDIKSLYQNEAAFDDQGNILGPIR